MARQLDEFFLVPFLNRTPKEQKQIIMEGKPQPVLMRLKSTSVHPVSKVKYTFVFDVAFYRHVEWLTGCKQRQALFCWPCVLFKGTAANEINTDVWNTIGFVNLLNLRDEILNHSRSASHIQSVLNLKLFTGYANDSPSNFVTLKDYSFENNCESAKRLIEVVCFIVSQRVPENIDHGNIIMAEECVQYLELQRRYDLQNLQLIDNAITLLKTNPKILTDILRSVIDVMQLEFQKEMGKAEYVSVIVNEHPKKKKSQYSLVLRYVNDGTVCERFMGFANITEAIHPTDVGNFVNEFINRSIIKFKIHRKILAFSFDQSPALQYVKTQRMMADVIDTVYYVPSYFLKFDFLLLQGLRYCYGCDRFLKQMLALRSFFEYGTKMRQELQSYLEGKLNFTNVPILEFSASYLDYFNFIKNHRTDLLSFLNCKINNNECIGDTDLIVGSGLHTFLKEFESVFLTETFIKLLSSILPLCDNRTFDSNLDIHLIQSIHNSLELEPQDEAFNKLWDTAMIEYKEMMESQVINIQMEAKLNDRKSYYKGLYDNIFKLICSQTKDRFLIAKGCVFLSLLNFRKVSPSNKWQSDSLKKIVSNHGTRFNYDGLKNELSKLDRNAEICKWEGLQKLMKFFLSHDLVESYPNVYKLIDLALALPCTLPEMQDSSTWYDIQTWSYSPETNKVIDNMSLLHVEKVYLDMLKAKVSFCDDVMTQMKNRFIFPFVNIPK